MTKYHCKWILAVCIAFVLASSFFSELIAKTNSNLKVLDITFDPVKRGKNVVRVKVQNLSSLDQIFKIHIQTRSPQLGKKGVGWGTQFFDTIKAKETRLSRFVFKVQGDITDDTWVRLRFSNPRSKQDEESKKFLEQKYMAKDLPQGSDVVLPAKEASNEQTEKAFKVFKSVQSHIKNAKYKSAWEMFSRDYQDAEFHGKPDMFEKAMDKVPPYNIFYWDKDEFLSLKPAKTILIDNRLVLEAVSDDLRWTIDLVEVDEKLKFNWIEGYVASVMRQANWKERLIPKMERHSTEHFDIYSFKDSTAHKNIDTIARQREKGYDEVCKFLGKQTNAHIYLIFFEDEDTKLKETGHQGMGWAEGFMVVEVYNKKENLDPYHETVHVLIRDFGNPPAMFNEGFAVYMSERLGACALEDLGGGRATIYERCKEIKASGQWISLRELMTYTEIGSTQSQPPISYAEAGGFVKFLIDTYGKDKFLQAYKTLNNSADKIVLRKNAELLKQIYGKSLAQLDRQWKYTSLRP